MVIKVIMIIVINIILQFTVGSRRELPGTMGHLHGAK
jgi:hypothetical protein